MKIYQFKQHLLDIELYFDGAFVYDSFYHNKLAYIDESILGVFSTNFDGFVLLEDGFKISLLELITEYASTPPAERQINPEVQRIKDREEKYEREHFERLRRIGR